MNDLIQTEPKDNLQNELRVEPQGHFIMMKDSIWWICHETSQHSHSFGQKYSYQECDFHSQVG